MISRLTKRSIIHILLGALPFFTCHAHAQDVEKESPLSLELRPALQYYDVDGDEKKFREDLWVGDGLSGGLEHVLLKKQLEGDWTLFMESRAITPEEDYKFLLDIKKRDLVFCRAGYSEYRKYFDDTGWYYSPFPTPVFNLNKDMHLDIGKLFLEAGIKAPNLPRFLAGYEHGYKKGQKSLLEWGSVTEGGLTRNIFPSFKEMDEELDMFKLEVDHTVAGVYIEDRFRYEHYKVETTRFEEERNLDAGTSEKVRISEKNGHDTFYNTLHVDSHLNEKFYLSMGYLLHKLDGDGAFDMLTAPFGPEPFDKNWRTRSLVLDQESHVLNLNAQFGPYRQLHFLGGIQAEFTDTDQDADSILTETLPGSGPVSPDARVESSKDKKSYAESAEIRYSGIPHTSLYVEGKWNQQTIDLHEREWVDDVPAFERLTDTDVNRKRYTLGFNSSPIPRVTFSGRYRKNHRKNDYVHRKDTEPGYSAFIDIQELKIEEISAKVTARWTNAVNSTFQYQRIKAEIDTLSQASPSASVASGDYFADIYSISIAAMPLADLYISGLFSYRDVNSESFYRDSPSVTDYDGDVFLFIGTAAWTIGTKTDLMLEYLYSRTDNFQNNAAGGLPLGIDNECHGLSLTFSRKISDRLLARLRYGFYKYDEKNNGGVNNYDAHLFGAGIEYRF